MPAVETLLTPMRAEAFAAYMAHSIAAYAQDNIDNGRWPARGAVERSRIDLLETLPQGLDTPNNHLFEIRETEAGPCVGVLWFAIEQRQGVRLAYVNDIEIYAAWQRRGHARRAFEALEVKVREMGISSIALHVFRNNPGAQALYAQLGFCVTGHNMTKHLDP
jgi:ribosomal protein S18 acetylase RimI-like enzyme